nr:glutamate receptor ionotropic, delta-1-like [Procambarus clarkii]
MVAGNASSCLTLVVSLWQPFTVFESTVPPYGVTGCAKDVIDIIAHHLSFCYRMVRAPDSDWGLELPNGTWTGSLGMLNRREAEMSAGVYSITDNRARAVDFSYPLILDEFSVAYKRPVIESDMAGFFKPFDPELWLLLLAALVVILVAICVIHQGHHVLPRTPKCREPIALPHSSQNTGLTWSGFLYSADRSFQWVISALLGQSMRWVPSGDSVRLVTGVWALTVLVVGSVYRSNLMARLVYPKLQLSFDSLEELGHTNIRLWAPLASRFHETLIASTQSSDFSHLRDQVLLGANVSEGLDGLFNGSWAFTTVRSSLSYFLYEDFTNKGSCGSYIMSRGFFGATSVSFAFPKGSPLRSQVDAIILDLHEFGIIQHLFKTQLKTSTECFKAIVSTADTSKRPLALADFYGVFFLYSTGRFNNKELYILFPPD